MTEAEVKIEHGVAIIIVGNEDHIKGLRVVQSHAVDAIGFYCSLLGFYPHTHLLILAGADAPYGGYPVGAGVIKIHGVNDLSSKPTDWWAWITSHEIGHMYWGYHVLDADRTKADQLGWLTIGLGLYADRLYVEARSLDCLFHSNQVAAFERALEEGRPTQFGLSKGEMEKDFDYNTVVRHGRAYSVIRSIAETTGKEVFIQILQDLLAEYEEKELSYDDLRSIVARRTVCPLKSFVEELDG